METFKENKEPVLIGLSGESCAGKNEAALILQKQGFFCIDADKISAKIFRKNEDKIFHLFKNEAEKKGISLKNEEGKFDKKKFALLVFSDSALLKRQEDFILPEIEKEIREKILTAFKACPSRPIVLNAPTLHKTSLAKECKFIFYITAPKIVRIWRAKKRDGLPLTEIFARFSKQKEFFSQYFCLNADIVIVKNLGSFARFEQRLLQELKTKGLLR
ncbi:dephospho-CoA kinase [Treponema pedis]|uniref:dephospho-CoA kinase n=1 Tax=Treponema pedis TaxID=409322 RepID=UPI0003FC7916|nr:dephospho-CoA kinase [Treponema pedis]